MSKRKQPAPVLHLDADADEEPLSQEADTFRRACINQYRHNGQTDLWLTGGTREQFIGFGRFLFWLDQQPVRTGS